MIEIGSRNNAPTSQHPTHDVYIFNIDLSRAATPFCFEQSTAGGMVGRAVRAGWRWMSWKPGPVSGVST